MTVESYRKRVLRVQLYIEENIDRELRLEELAAVAGFSPFYFHRLFKAHVGETLADYIRRVRLEASSIALKYTELAVLEIALGAGYQTHEAFTRAFGKRFGVSPTQFRSGVTPTRNHQKETPQLSITSYRVEIREVPPKTVAFLRHVGPYQDCGPTFQKLLGWAAGQGLLGPDSEILGLSHDDPAVTEPSKIRFDCCLTVGSGFEAQGEVLEQRVEGGRYAVLRHQGPYTELAAAYHWFFAVWLPESKEELREICPYEIYLSDPERTPPEELLTEVYLPLL